MIITNRSFAAIRSPRLNFISLRYSLDNIRTCPEFL